MFFDSHVHYDDSRYDKDRATLLRGLPENGVDYVINAGASMASSAVGIQLSQEYNYIFAAVGVHPHKAESMNPADIEILESYSREKKVVAIGEIGLDFYYDHSPRDLQRKWFIEQMELAQRTGLPIIIHSRDAAQECYDIVKRYSKNINGGVIHCFSGSVEMARGYVDLGFHLGVGGVVTFPKAKTLVEVVQAIPLDKLLLETDCPYLSPIPHRGERNDSQKLSFIAAKIAEIKHISIDEVANVTKQSTLEVFVHERVIA